jgi:hypothetical protein
VGFLVVQGTSNICGCLRVLKSKITKTHQFSTYIFYLIIAYISGSQSVLCGGFHGYIFVMATLKFTYFLTKGMMFC